MKNIKQKGYTLLEILVIVVIMGTLAYFSVPLYNKIIQKSDVSDALHNIEMLSGAQSKYFIENGRYTSDLSTLETPLKGDEAEIFTSNFTYFAGDPRENNYCIYSQSNIRDYTLARNYRTNSEILCSGADCDKISSFVQQGSLSDLCGSAYNDECDRTCTEPKVLDAKCNCVCPTGCSKKELQNDDCSCYCAPKWRERCSGSNQIFDENDCSCSCKETLSCAEGQTFDVATCECVGASTCSLTDKECKEQEGVNFIADLKECTCKCKFNEDLCRNENAIFDAENCRCIQKEQGCTLNEEKCKDMNPNYTFDATNCECSCPLSPNSCNSKQKFENCACSCSDEAIASCSGQNLSLDENCNCSCGLTEEKCKEQNEHYLLNNSDGNCSCYCALSKRDCAKWNLVYNASSCACEEQDCDKTLAQCQAMNSNYILNSNCNCVCGLEEKDCTDKGMTFYEAKCQCTDSCNKTVESCKKLNANWTLLDGCTCGCPKITECPKGQVWNEESCSCESTFCSNGLTEEQCKAQNPNFILVMSKTCHCECGIDKFKCNELYGNGAWFDIDNCVCVP